MSSTDRHPNWEDFLHRVARLAAEMLGEDMGLFVGMVDDANNLHWASVKLEPNTLAAATLTAAQIAHERLHDHDYPIADAEAYERHLRTEGKLSDGEVLAKVPITPELIEKVRAFARSRGADIPDEALEKLEAFTVADISDLTDTIPAEWIDTDNNPEEK
jgi:hypothetical protein